MLHITLAHAVHFTRSGVNAQVRMDFSIDFHGAEDGLIRRVSCVVSDVITELEGGREPRLAARTQIARPDSSTPMARAVCSSIWAAFGKAIATPANGCCEAAALDRIRESSRGDLRQMTVAGAG